MADLDVQLVTNIEGLDELEEAFTEGSRRAVRAFLRKVEMKAAKVLADNAKEYSPFLTGQLEGEIHRETVQGDGTLTVRVGPGKAGFYGMFQEFGAPEAHVPALHWLENSARAAQDEVLDVYMEAVREGLEDMKK